MFDDLLERLGLASVNSGACDAGWIERPGGEVIRSVNPATGESLAEVVMASVDDYQRIVERSCEAFVKWRQVPAPKRGEVVRQLGVALRERKRDLGLLVTLETGKIRSEGEGEVQEMIDMCDFAVGLSRQLHGLTIASERPLHRMMEQWHPLGPVGIITAFNFPVAVWAWNAALAAVCGDSMIWKPSPETPLTAIAVQKIVNEVADANDCAGVFSLAVGGANDVGESLIQDPRLPLISATGSCRMGARVAEVVARRMGRSLLELGGNNAIIVTPSADLELALRGTLFAAVGTAGQRCTTVRRLIVHESLIETVIERLKRSFASLRIGNPWDDGVLMGPLINERAVETMRQALESAVAQGGTVLYGGKRLPRPGFFVEPALVRAEPGMPIVGEETFAPILYVLSYSTLDEAISIQNSVAQGLTSAIFTNDLRESEQFLSVEGSDCGIANVNIGTSGAEIGGAFGGEKATGGGREAGSDAWKTYMRRQTCTVNRGSDLPLAQGVKFDTEHSMT
ncbi:aldehyde dehydrogenase (NAD+) [Singulisphaera sp. GP187]|uniref:L-piperidine-6-carboxylate dehydrogenase n=1 Tax=Singulisphaera sp. GP187 TaxID=1882752 RepID=UPI00092872D4|nr:aldehyde dehydrogenase family protein [Singulisphaera sp. GP187]SIO62046.1 aldehyde dehydrogenase (NAD+) [Singulisphaera sp. GP187]